MSANSPTVAASGILNPNNSTSEEEDDVEAGAPSPSDEKGLGLITPFIMRGMRVRGRSDVPKCL